VVPAGHNSARSDAPGDGSGDFDALLRAAQAGRSSAWDELFHRLAPAIAGYLRLRGAREVDDLTSDVFLGVFRNIGGFTGDEAAFRSWVFVIAHRRLQDERRRFLRRPQPDSFDAHVAYSAAASGPAEPVGGDAEEDALRALATDRVKGICARLAPDQADVVLLRIIGDLTIDQVAEVLGKSPGAVKQLQRRALAAVQRLLERQGVPL
jgi:RNA polymerase sigma-70 factor (ECF subfamily)